MKVNSAHVIPVAILVLASLTSPAAQAAVDMFLKITDIDGESQDKDHSGEIDLLAWSWQLSRDSSGDGTRPGPPIIRPISIVKYIDGASTDLYNLLLTGNFADAATLTVRKAGDRPIEFIKIDLTRVYISSVSNGGSGGEDRPTEQISLGFSKVCITYTPELPDGSGGAEEMTCWDVAANTPF